MEQLLLNRTELNIPRKTVLSALQNDSAKNCHSYEVALVSENMQGCGESTQPGRGVHPYSTVIKRE